MAYDVQHVHIKTRDPKQTSQFTSTISARP
jgi:hypothetical protein